VIFDGDRTVGRMKPLQGNRVCIHPGIHPERLSCITRMTAYRVVHLLFPEFPDGFAKPGRMFEGVIGGMNRYCDNDTREYESQHGDNDG
jgi:hypothetical protein